MKYFILLIFVFFSKYIIAQNTTDTIASIEVNPTANGYSFNADLPALQAIPGGRAPFYTYFWDFGDGHFSRQENPEHNYINQGNYEVKLYATNNYDMGTKPIRPTRPTTPLYIQTASNNVLANADEANFFAENPIFKLDKNSDALPGSDMVVIAGVKPTNQSGTIYILSNEKIFGAPGFVLEHQTTYNGEQLLEVENNINNNQFAGIENATITHSGSPNYGKAETKTFVNKESVDYFKNLYNSYQSLSVYKINGDANAPQFSFLKMGITPEMLQDTNAIITITGIYIPDNSSNAYIHQLDIPIVASHDPNRMTLKQTRMNYRLFSKKKKLNYKVQFQNDGEGDAKNIKLAMALPEDLDMNSFELQSLYPECPPCNESRQIGCWQMETNEKDSIIFNFKGISLPGSKAADNIDYDSTKGYIRFTVNAEKRLPNKPFKGKTAIYFDKNEPVITNFATGRFKKSLSPLVLSGYNFALGKKEDDLGIHKYNNNLLLGFGIAPLAPYKKLFWQVEVYGNYYEETITKNGINEAGILIIGAVGYQYEGIDSFQKLQNLKLGIAVMPIKYNINRYISIGAGLDANARFNLKKESAVTYHILPVGSPTITLNYAENRETIKPITIKPFVDLNIGNVYLGPTIGLRYYQGFTGYNNLLAYVQWRF